MNTILTNEELALEAQYSITYGLKHGDKVKTPDGDGFFKHYSENEKYGILGTVIFEKGKLPKTVLNEVFSNVVNSSGMVGGKVYPIGFLEKI